MPWVVGIDEAGYGPNLGPLVQASVALWLPDHDPTGWEVLKPVIRRAGEKADGRILVDDSKLVHSGAKKFAKLERGVWAFTGHTEKVSFAEFLRNLSVPDWLTNLSEEVWFQPGELLPQQIDNWESFAPVAQSCGVRIGPIAVKALCPGLFNKIIAGSGSKATAISTGLIELLSQANRAVLPNEPIIMVGDKQGGRAFYAPLLQAAFPEGWIVTESETPEESRYRVENVSREVTILFRPRADSGSVAVAMASMLAKYVREVCMSQFNRFCEKHVPGLKPTAGYPTDAKRFYAEIRPTLAALGIAEDSVWRQK